MFSALVKATLVNYMKPSANRVKVTGNSFNAAELLKILKAELCLRRSLFIKISAVFSTFENLYR